MTGPANSGIYRALLGDAEVASYLSDKAQIRAMLVVEAALARAQAAIGMIPEKAAQEIDRVARELVIEPQDLAESTYEVGLPVVVLVARLRDAVGDEAAHYVHWGATSQDIMDTALVLNLRAMLQTLQQRMDTLAARLATLARTHRDTVMAGRTRSQQAVPTTFGAKVAGWLAALLRHRRRLNELRCRLLVAQLGAAAGTLAPFGDKGLALTEAFAREFDLEQPDLPWHGQRDTIAELGGWLATTTSILGKLGQDCVLLAQSEVAEVRFAGGGSSTMPQKANPVLAEVLVALARHAAGLSGTLQFAAVHAHERDGAAWTTEWLTLPQLAEATGTALRHGLTISEKLQVDPARMRANLDAASGTIMAEAASFALAGQMARAEAKALVTRGCLECAESGTTLTEWLGRNTDAEIDWDAVAEPSNWLGSAGEMVDRVCAEADRQLAGS